MNAAEKADKLLMYVAGGASLIWIDDKQNVPFTAEYIVENSVAVIQDREYAIALAEGLQTREREKKGCNNTRYVVTTRGQDDHVLGEDMTEEELRKLLGFQTRLPE